MKKLKSKTMAIMIAAILTISMAASITLIPNANAHTPAWTIISYAYLTVSPSPIGVGQTVGICMWVDAPVTGADLGNTIRRHDYKLTITDPDGKIETQTWSLISDPTGVQYYRYTPGQVGTYTFTFNYPGQTYTWNQANTPGLVSATALYENDTFTPASATKTLIVQQDQIAAPIDSYPLPTEYWTYPIEGQNTYWYTIASNWLGSPYIPGANAAWTIPGAFQPYGSGPNSAHVMWTRPLEYGGIAGGNDTAVLGEGYFNGLSYNARFANPIIIQGTLFYSEPWGNSGSGGPYVAVDLKTGQQLWSINTSATGTNLIPSFGYTYSLENPNQHGILPNGLLMASTSVSGLGTVWRGYDPRTGTLTTMNITNVPVGTNVAGPLGEYLKYTLTNLGTPTNPKWYLAQWNSSKVFGLIPGIGSSISNWYSGTANASLPSAYDWNVSIPSLTGTGWIVGTNIRGAIPLVSLGNIALLIQGGSASSSAFGGHLGDMSTTMTTDPTNITAISLKPQTLGNVLWTQSYPQASGNNTRWLTSWVPTKGVFVFMDKESLVHYGYSLSDGSLLWGPVKYTNDSANDWNYQNLGTEQIAYGNLYVGGFSGIVYCFDDKTGNLKWTYGNGGADNSTNSEMYTPYGNYPTFISVIADGKVYLVTNEHSPNTPLFKGAQLRAINATDGTEIWTIMDYGAGPDGGQYPVAAGYLVTYDAYNSLLYSYGKGPSALTVTAPNLASPSGAPLVIRGTVTDIAAGTKQDEQAARFPNGVAAVSDASQSQWMEYVYMQKPKPTNITGVPVTISVLDSNGNFRQIGNTTSDGSGMYTLTWTPDITGDYTVIATFAGSESYYPSSAETSFTASTPAATASPYPVVTLPPTEMYFAASTVAIIIAIAIVGAVLLLAVRKRP
jgi:outer membrane protein assembly factor BamB